MKETLNSSSPACGLPAPNATPARALFALALIAAGGVAGPVLAADPAVNSPGTQVVQAASPSPAGSPSSQTGPQQQVTPPATGAGITPFTIPPSPPLAQDPYALADQLKVRGWIISLPGAAATADQGLFGARNALAEKGISWLGFATTTFSDNLLRHGLPPGNRFGPHSRDLQQYSGQLPTYNSSNVGFVNYDLRRYGIPDGQITIGGYLISTNWNPSLPNGVGVAAASYYQTLFNKRVEIKAGILSNNLEFLGTQIGGNLASGVFGVNAFIGVENGLSAQSLGAPGVNVRVNLSSQFYTKLGVQRALSPNGVLAERAQNPSGVRFTVPNAGVLVIDEVGYRVNPAPGQMQTWIRAAANYTSSRYTDVTAPTTRHNPNFGLYLLADRQIWQTAPNAGPGSAARGLYAGFSVMYTPSYFNVFSQYYEGRLYGFGLIPGRPFDQVSLVANRNVFSEDAVRGVRRAGLLSHDDANTYTAAYSARVLPGVNLNFGVSYVDHPTTLTYNRSTGSALNALANIFIFL